MRKLVIFSLLSTAILSIQAQRFEDYFEDRTLRLDYTFCGDTNHQQIYVDELTALPRWFGRHQRLAELPAPGPIPLRCLQSVNIGNLLATGRAISCDGEAFASLRVMATAFALGEAAGVSAWANGDARNTRVQLQKQGAIV